MSTPPLTEKRRTCTDHCATCDLHFHGLGAFDAHRRNGYCAEPGEVLYPEGSKREGQPMLQVWTAQGSCEHMRGCWQDGRRVRWEEPVTVWQMAVSEADRERLQERLSESRGQESGRVTRQQAVLPL